MIDFARRYIDAWNRHRASDIATFMLPDATFTDTTVGETFRGPAEIGHWADLMSETLSSDYAFELTSAFSSPPDIALEWTMRGTHDRASPQLPATGKPFEVHGVSIGRLRDGKIAENRDYWTWPSFSRRSA
jgi:steroid delta-isomerase-like uncharacterized protein